MERMMKYEIRRVSMIIILEFLFRMIDFQILNQYKNIELNCLNILNIELKSVSIKMNINQHYGNLDLPSDIVDSFDHHGQSSIENSELSPPRFHMHLHQSRYVNEDVQSDFNNHPKANTKINANTNFNTFNNQNKVYMSSEQDQINLSSSFQDTFLANLPTLIEKNKQNTKNFNSQSLDQPDIAINKTKIIKNLLPSQQVVEYVQIINSCSSSVALTIICPVQIEIDSNEGYHKNISLIPGETNVRQFFLDSWQKIEVGFKIVRRDEQLGDIFETICLESRVQNGKQIESKKKRSYIEVQVHYSIPRLKLNYQGCSDVVSVSLNKVSINRIQKNRFGEYSFQIGINCSERFECNIQAKGEVKVFPNELVLFNNQTKKIHFKNSSKNAKGVIIIRAKNAKICFVFGVELI